MCKYLQLGTTNLEKPSIYFLNYCKSKIYKKKFTEFQELNEEVRRKNSGFVEGLNNKIKVLKRRCYGLFDTGTLFQRLFLDLQGGAIYA